MFLKSRASAVKSILGLGRGVRTSITEPFLPPRRSDFSGRVLRGMRRLLDFAMKGVATKRRIILLYLELFSLKLFVPSGCIARGRFSFFSRFSALDGDDFAGHAYSFSLGLSSDSSSSGSTSATPTASTVPRTPRRRWRRRSEERR